MFIENARQAENNISADNIFYVYDDHYKPIGKATTYTFENHMDFDEFPTNFCFDIHKSTVNDEARALLLGAVIAKAYMYRAEHPYHSTKIYTNIDPHDSASVHFFQNSGLKFGECEEELLLNPPPTCKFNPKENNCTVEELKLHNADDITQLCNRMNQYMLQPISRDKLIDIAKSGNPIKVLVTKHNGNIIAELAFFVRPLQDEFGRFGTQAEGTKEAVVIGLYTHPTYRKYGVATNLLSKAYKYLSMQNIYFFRAKLQRRSRSQKALASKCKARTLGVSQYCPRLDEIKQNVEPQHFETPYYTQQVNLNYQTIQAQPEYTEPSQSQYAPITDWNALYQQAYSARRSKNTNA